MVLLRYGEFSALKNIIFFLLKRFCEIELRYGANAPTLEIPSFVYFFSNQRLTPIE